ncbi:hypothetical protein, partial [Flavobacterium daejeonense]|uniref:hypothetical protein n=1 Tax=Flavobacterium daejeonense TaxID=350893 RepID=UPI00054DE912
MKTTVLNLQLKQYWVNVLFKNNLLLFLILLFCSHTLIAQTKFDCNSCNSSDEKILSVELVSTTLNPNPLGSDDLYLPLSPSCTSGDAIQGYLKINVQQQSTTRYGFLVEADIYTNGIKTDDISFCNPASTNSGIRSVYITNKVISWTCGTTISLQKIIIGWGNSTGQNVCNLDNCKIGPQCSNNELNPTVTVITPLNADFTTERSCPGGTQFENIKFISTSTGGTTPYQYQWVISDGINTTTTPYSSTNNYTYAPANTNNLTVTLNVKDATAVQKTDSETKTGIAVGTCCTIAINPITKTNVTCNGASNGTVTATITGGTGTITYDLLYSATSGGSFTDTNLPTNGDSNGIYTGLGIGFYKVKVTEANGCSVTSSEVEITQPTTIVVSNVSQSTIDCNGGDATVTITAAGGT